MISPAARALGNTDLDPAEKIAWPRLARSSQVGPQTFRALLNEYGTAESALAALPGLARRGGARDYRACPEQTARGELERAEACGARLLCLPESDFPAMLREIDPPPPLIYAKGNAALLHGPAIAIVGSRNASALGQGFAKSLAADLAEAGFLIVSGMARGIDTAAHLGSLGIRTAAVLAGGIDTIYPPDNAGLYEDIARFGVLVSESPPGLQPRAQDFPRRNRLISGLSLGVIVIEAARQSGSLVTARFALEQGREVFAVPGHPLDPRAAGTNALIRNGATLITGASDVITALEPLLRPPLPGFGEPDHSDKGAAAMGGYPADARPHIAEEARRKIRDALCLAPVEIDMLARMTGFSVRVVNVVLLELELSGCAERHPANRASLRV
jgi:DNA processing protein